MESWPLKGRGHELTLLAEALNGISFGGVFLVGGAGVGKTRLAEEAVSIARQSGWVPVSVQGTRSAANLPLGTLAPHLPPFRQSATGAANDPADVLRESAKALVELAGGDRLLLSVDDAHLLDDLSATLLHQLVTRSQVFVLATVRAGETMPDALVALWKDGRIERLEVEPLNISVIAEILTTVLGGEVDPMAVTVLTARCEGNLIFLRELVAGAVGDGTLQLVDGVWGLKRPLSPSARLVALVETRLCTLTPDERTILEVASLAQPLGQVEVTTFADPALAADLERKGLLISRIEGRRLVVTLGHPLYGEVIRAGLPSVRARQLTRRLADLVEETGARRREDSLRVASWRLDGGGAHPKSMLEAATIARWRYDFPLAERLAEAALEAGGGFEAAALTAQLAGLRGRNEEAEQRLLALADQAQTNRERALVALARIDNHAFSMGRMVDALHLAERAERLIEPPERAEITARRAAILFALEGARAASTVVEPLMEEAEGPALAWACITAAYVRGRSGRFAAAVDATALGISVQSDLDEPLPWYSWFHLIPRCEALTFAGRLAEAHAIAEKSHEKSLEDGSIEAQAAFAWQLSRIACERGQVRTAARFGREAVTLFRQLRRQPFLEDAMIHLSLALALGGHVREARTTLDELDAMAIPSTAATAVDRQQAEGWIAVAAGDLPGGRASFDRASKTAEQTGDIVGNAAALHAIARVGGEKGGVVRRLEDVARDMEGDLAPARAAHARALVHLDPQALELASRAFEDFGCQLLAAEAAADATRAWRRAGEDRRATRASRRAADLQSRCEMARTPALYRIDGGDQLTRAERDTAMLAASGRSNREIAAQLYVSVRTIENHLHHVYEKLGITGRADLAAALLVDNASTPRSGEREK